MAVADRISVMRKGRMLQTIAKAETNERELARLMVGREIGAAVPERACTPGEDILLVEDLVAAADHGQRALKGLNLRVRQGEIVGIAGVAGNGQKELAEVLAGLRSWQEGRVVLNGKPMSPGNVKAFLEQGTAHIPENRMHSGLAGNLGAVDNLLLKSYRTKERSRFGMLRSKENRQWSKELIEQFDVKTPDLNTPVRQLSGGNQQKLLFAREIERRPRLMVAVHPTQGLDVGAAESVHRMLIRLRDEGSGVLLISEDLDELLQLSDRILVLYNGVIRGETSREEADLDLIGMWMAGVAAEEEVEG
jgi:simple sugar transport system ATP-binding protein